MDVRLRSDRTWFLFPDLDFYALGFWIIKWLDASQGFNSGPRNLDLEAGVQHGRCIFTIHDRHIPKPDGGTKMMTTNFKGVEIEVCPNCGAVLLDPGELEQLAGEDQAKVVDLVGRFFGFRRSAE